MVASISSLGLWYFGTCGFKGSVMEIDDCQECVNPLFVLFRVEVQFNDGVEQWKSRPKRGCEAE